MIPDFAPAGLPDCPATEQQMAEMYDDHHRNDAEMTPDEEAEMERQSRSRLGVTCRILLAIAKRQKRLSPETRAGIAADLRARRSAERRARESARGESLVPLLTASVALERSKRGMVKA